MASHVADAALPLICPRCTLPLRDDGTTLCPECGLPIGRTRNGPVLRSPLGWVLTSYAGVGQRLGALAIDLFLLDFVTGLVQRYWLGVRGFSSAKLDMYIDPQRLLILLTLSFVYFVALEASPKQGTLGKMTFGIIVMDETNNRISPQRAALRYAGRLLALAIFPASVWMLTTRVRRQSLHDALTRTQVVNRRYLPQAPPEHPAPKRGA
ncbi:MAG: RDD family protein [Dehalococcoidia bacterium]|nr:RDD family protein [Dehalococcoidia bacterium]